MRKSFPGFYRPSPEDFDALWGSAVFVLDANVLLNVYRYSGPVREAFLGLLAKMKGRLWVPYQAALEYQDNRLTVISQQQRAYEAAKAAVTKQAGVFKGSLSQFSRHPLLDLSSLREPIDLLEQQALALISQAEKQHPDLSLDDTYREQLTAILEGCIGEQLTPVERAAVEKDTLVRNEQKRPPGFRDGSKDAQHRLGDAVIWSEILRYGKLTKKPIIFVTDDAKDDWWWTHSGKTIGPRPELIKEYLEATGCGFYMYLSLQFMERANDWFKVAIGDVITEERALRAWRDATTRASADDHTWKTFLDGGIELSGHPLLRDQGGAADAVFLTLQKPQDRISLPFPSLVHVLDARGPGNRLGPLKQWLSRLASISTSDEDRVVVVVVSEPQFGERYEQHVRGLPFDVVFGVIADDGTFRETSRSLGTGYGEPPRI